MGRTSRRRLPGRWLVRRGVRGRKTTESAGCIQSVTTMVDDPRMRCHSFWELMFTVALILLRQWVGWCRVLPRVACRYEGMQWARGSRQIVVVDAGGRAGQAEIMRRDGYVDLWWREGEGKAWDPAARDGTGTTGRDATAGHSPLHFPFPNVRPPAPPPGAAKSQC